MSLDLEQTILVGLTMKLDLKTREYKNLCKKLDEYKNSNMDKNSEEYVKLLQEFEENRAEVVKINRQLRELQNKEK